MSTRVRPRRIVLAYSGGLNASVAIPWLAESAPSDQAPSGPAVPVDVVTTTLDLGQGGELEGVRDRALGIGAVRAHVLDVREDFARDHIVRALKADALADDRSPMVSALAVPLIARKLVEIAGIEQTTIVAHGAADPASAARFEAAVRSLNPELTVLAPAKSWAMSRQDAIDYAEKRHIALPAALEAARSADANAWGRSVSCALDAWNEPPEELFALTQPASTCPGEPAYVDLQFERGVPTALNGVSMPLSDLIASVAMIAGSHGVGRLDIAASRSAREIGEAPAAVVLHAAHAELQKLVTPRDAARFSRRVSREYAEIIERGTWFSPLREALDAYVDRIAERVSGAIRLKLFKGDARIVGRKPAEPRPAAKRLRVVAAKTH